MTHENNLPPLFDDTSSDDEAARALYARPAVDDDADAPEVHDHTPPPVDIDSALAALASLQDLAFQEEPFSDEDYVPHESTTTPADAGRRLDMPTPVTGEWNAVAVPPPSAPAWSSPLTDANQPPLLTVERGQAASIVPALLLIGGGVWGLFLVATGGTLPLAQLPALAMLSLGAVLLVLWASLGRRSTGSLFGGLVLLALGGAAAFLTQTATWATHYPLLAVALGAACLVSSAGIAAYRRWLLLFGLGFILGGAGLFLLVSQAALPPLGTLVPLVMILALGVPLLLRLLIPTLPARPVPPAQTPVVEDVAQDEAIMTETTDPQP